MGAECGFQTKQQLNECLLRYPWSEHPLPPVHRACRDGNFLSLTYLTIQGDRLEVFRSINEQDQFLMWTPAHWAAYFGKVDCLKRLVECGLNIDVCEGRFEQSPTHLAAFAGHAEVLHWLLQNGAFSQKLDSLGETPVHKAARGGNSQCLRLLQAFGTPLSTFNMYRQTPCDLASSLGYDQCAQFLRGHGCATVSNQRKSKRMLDDGDDTEQAKRRRNDMVQYLDHVEIFGSNVVSHDLYVSNGTIQETGVTAGMSSQSGYVHNSSDPTRNNNYPLLKSSDVDMNCDEVQERNTESNLGSHYLNQPVRCLSLCGHLQ